MIENHANRRCSPRNMTTPDLTIQTLQKLCQSINYKVTMISRWKGRAGQSTHISMHRRAIIINRIITEHGWNYSITVV